MASVFVRGMASSAAESAIKHVTVIGGGLMGSGIAQVSVFVTFTKQTSYSNVFNMDGVSSSPLDWHIESIVHWAVLCNPIELKINIFFTINTHTFR